jgi:Ca2+/Na+ antiporter
MAFVSFYMFIKFGSSDTKILSFLLMIFFISVITFILFKIKNKNKNHKYYKDWNTREEILKQIQLLTVDDVEFIKNSTLLTLKEKKDIIIDIYSKDGFTVNNISVTQMQFRKEKSFSLLWAILWLFVFIVGLLVYIFYYISKRDDIVTVTLDPSNCKDDEKKDVEEKSTINNSKTKELLELKDMLEKELISKEDFENLKSELLKISSN